MQFSWRVADGDGAFNPSPTGSNITTFTVTSVDDPPVVSWRANGCHHGLTAEPADPIISISDADDPVSGYSICVVAINDAAGSKLGVTTGGGVTVIATSVAETPVLKNGATVITAPVCIPVNARSALTLTSSIFENGGSVQWVLRRNRDAKDFPPAQTMGFVAATPPCP